MKKIYRAMAGFFLAALLAVGLASLFTTGSGTAGASTKKPECVSKKNFVQMLVALSYGIKLSYLKRNDEGDALW